jgi:regulator of replication initiation timing
MELDKIRCYDDAVAREEKTQVVLARLQSLKCKVSELREQCEALKLQSEKPKKALVCSECGKLIKEGAEVTVKDTSGIVKGCYHEECFKALLSS